MNEPFRTALEAMIDRLEEIEDASIAASAAAQSAWKTVHDLETFIASAKSEASSDVASGAASQGTADYALRMLSRAHKAAMTSAVSADAKKNELRGQIDVLKWAISLVGDALSVHRDVSRPSTSDTVVEDIKKRKTRATREPT